MLLNCLLVATLSMSAAARQMLDILDAIPDKTWKASGSSYIAQMSDEEFNSMLMPLHHLREMPAAPMAQGTPDDGVPDSYDYRDKHPHCAGKVFDQGYCGSCWAFSATSTFSDRRCVAGKTDESVPLSQQYQVSCDFHNDGCQGGGLISSWDFFVETGVPVMECVHYTHEAFDHAKAVDCPTTCDDGSNITLVRAKSTGTWVNDGPEQMKTALHRNGPLISGLIIYSDFKYYESGIYKHVTGGDRGGHAIEIVGYGSENGTDFWRVRNSWGKHWGEDGFFRIVRGVNECIIETNVVDGGA